MIKSSMGVLPDLILASQSPRRKELLGQTGLDFQIIIRPTDEVHDAEMTPDALCLLNARLKATVVFEEFPDCTVIGADTLVFIDGIPLGKPRDIDEARAMLRQLSGREHIVCTGVALMSPLSIGSESFAEMTKVCFKPLDEETIEAYLNAVPVLDKAGAYAFQDHGDMIIDHIVGYASNVIGLPLETLSKYLHKRGYQITPFSESCP
ncbi:MAG: Maf family protein [Akkermansia sp.]